LALLARAGVTGPDAVAALRVLIVYTVGFAAFAVRSPLEPDDHPHLSGDELRQTFDRGLRWLLSGVTVDGRAGLPS
jgi:hypothetical protein